MAHTRIASRDRSAIPALDDASVGRHVIDKISRHLLWFLFLLFVFSFLDRINIGFAGLTMMGDLGLTGTQFGLATTLFYVAYIACGIPSNMILARVRRQKMDRQHHDRLGAGLHGDDVRDGSRTPCTCCGSWSASRKRASCRACCST